MLGQREKRTFYERYVKRCLDVFFALLLLIGLSPLFLIIALLSKILTPGPIFFVQYRTGQNGKVFKIYKFRTMTGKNDKQGNLLPDSLRVTGFGKFLRRFALDELPQLVNILCGKMSFIGPRPRIVKDTVFYSEDLLKIYQARPGLTGLAQVSGGRSRASWEDVFKKDLEYQQKITFWSDFIIVLKTIFVLVFNTDGLVSGTSRGVRECYFYVDYLIKHNYITAEQYELGLKRAEEIIMHDGTVTYFADLNPHIKQGG